MKNLCVVFGGASPEHDISIITGMQLAKNLASKYSVTKIYLGLDNKFYLADKVDNLSAFANKEKLNLKPVIFYNGAMFKLGFGLKKIMDVDCIINCCHGGVGENGDLSAYFNLNNIKTTSAGALASHIAMDKQLAKLVVGDIVPTVPGVLVSKFNINNCAKQIKKLGNSLIVKPNSLGSSIGVKACNNSNYLDQIQAIFVMNDEALVEKRIENLTEYNQACYIDNGKLILSAIENPISKNDFLTFNDKYLNNAKQKGGDRIIPAKIDTELKNKICAYTKAIYTKLNLNGVVRIDYIFDNSTQTLYFNEVNTIPGSMAFYLYEPVGIDYITLIEKQIQNAQEIKKYSYFKTDVLNKKI